MSAEPRSILVVRLDGLGDAIACIPALEGLRRAYPQARFGIVCSPQNAGLLSDRLACTYVFRSGAALDGVAAQTRSDGYEYALVATEEVAGYLIARASGARRCAGFWHRFDKPFKSLWQRTHLTDPVYRPAAWIKRPEHEVEALYRLAQALGAQAPPPREPESLRPWLAIDQSGRIDAGGAPLAIQVSAKLAARGWGPAALGLLAAEIFRTSSFARCILLAAPADEALARSVWEHFERAARPGERASVLVLGSLQQWLGAVASAAMLVTPDSGGAHAAGMLGVPVVDLFEPDHFEQLARRWRPWASPSRCLVKPAWHPGAEHVFGAQIAAAISEIAA